MEISFDYLGLFGFMFVQWQSFEKPNVFSLLKVMRLLISEGPPILAKQSAILCKQAFQMK